MSEIYVVMQGWYSDRHIAGMFSEEKDADDLIELINDGGDCSVEEYILDDPNVLEVLRTRLFLWDVTMDKNGNNVYASQEDLPYCLLENVNKARFELGSYRSKEKPPYEKRHRRRDRNCEYCWRRPVLAMEVKAKDKKHAIKIVNEKRGQVIANNQWPEWDDETGKYKDEKNN